MTVTLVNTADADTIKCPAENSYLQIQAFKQYVGQRTEQSILSQTELIKNHFFASADEKVLHRIRLA